ncbi:hypothetical protein QE152_g10407 [Popillia japonica]|uniref:Uncharacterized protein n=1 Tax=Popillia japonica TaxID=7064 RepID=A0AAW1LVI5_POPJA
MRDFDDSPSDNQDFGVYISKTLGIQYQRRRVLQLNTESYLNMDHDDDEGVGFIAESHYAKSASEDRQAAVSLLQGPVKQSKGSFLSSNVNDIDVPIYSTDNLTGPKRKPVTGFGNVFGNFNYLAPYYGTKVISR